MSKRQHRDGFTTINGYEYYYDTDQSGFRIHRLAAVAEHGFEAVSESVVHHKNGCTIDNGMSNLKLMERDEHSKLHFPERGFVPGNENVDGDTCKIMRSMYESGTPIESVADKYSLSISGVWAHLSGECHHSVPSITPGYDGPRDGPWRDEDLFVRLYEGEGLTYTELSERWDCSLGTISRWAKKHGVTG